VPPARRLTHAPAPSTHPPTAAKPKQLRRAAVQGGGAGPGQAGGGDQGCPGLQPCAGPGPGGCGRRRPPRGGF